MRICAFSAVWNGPFSKVAKNKYAGSGSCDAGLSRYDVF